MNILTPAWLSAVQRGYRYSIDWSHPITLGLKHVDVMNGVQPTSLYSGDGNLRNTDFEYVNAFAGIGPAGVGLVANGASARADWFKTSAYLAPRLNQVEGSAFAYVGFGASDTTNGHCAFSIEDSIGSSLFHCVRYIDNNWYFGWVSARAIGTYAWPTNTSGTVGGVYSSAASTGTHGTRLWINGKLAISNVNSPTGFDTAAGTYRYSIGGMCRNTQSYWSWLAPGGVADPAAAIYWVAFWDRILNDSEIVYLNANPMCFLLPQDDDMSILQAALAQWQLYFSKNSGAYEPVTTTSVGVKSADASTDADETKILIPRL